MNLIQDCILCYNEFEEGSAPCGDTQNLSEVCCKYLHPLITQKISSSHSSRDKLLLCPKCFESVVELKDLNQQLTFLQARISELVFIRSLEILHRRGKSNNRDDNRPNDDNLERQLLLIELDVSTLPKCNFMKVNSNVPKDIVTSEKNYDLINNPVEDICFEELPDPLVIPSSDINTVDVTFETVKVEGDEVDLIDNSHGINNIPENLDADLCVEKSKQISDISTVNTKTKELNYCEKVISIQKRQDNFAAEDGKSIQIDGAEKAPGANFEIADESKISSDGCFNGSSQNCASTMNLGSLSNQQISEEKNPASATTSGSICSSTSKLGNQNSHLIESVSQVIDEEQHELQEVLPEINSKKNDSKNDLSYESKNRCRRVLQSKIGHGERGKISFKWAASGKGFGQQCDLKKHERVHSAKQSNLKALKKVHYGEKRFHCEFCGKEFFTKMGLYLHNIEIHTDNDERPYKCEVCGKGFNQQCYLKLHERVHSGEKPFICEFCGKEFSRLGVKNRHTRIHTDDRQHNCEVCGKRFNEKWSLKVHKMMHTGEKPYICEFCGKGFVLSSGLNNHVRTHTGEKLYKCAFCGEGFVQKAGLNQHIRTHTGEKPYKCEFCGVEFASQSGKYKHVSTHTGRKNLM